MALLPPRLPLALAAALTLASCGNPGSAHGRGRGPDFVIGGIPVTLSSGAAFAAAGGAALYVSDQVDTCLAVLQVPTMTVTLFQLQVAAQADGTTAATVVARKPAPAPGEAVGGISVSTGGTPSATLDASDGAVAWTANPDRTLMVTALDVGFAGTSDRLVASGLLLQPCPP